MERLTEKIGSRYDLKHCLGENSCSETSGICLCGECSFPGKAYQKLGEYEDLEEQGKLLKLPCAVGDTVYVIEADMKSFNYNHIKGKITKAKFDYWMIPSFGSLVFLTREEAEAALKEL